MARRNGSITGGLAALGLLALLFGGAIAGLLSVAVGDPSGAWQALDARLASVVTFTLMQAGLSTLLSVGLALPLAIALNRQRDFAGRALLLRLFALPMAMPAIIVALAILALFGRNGLLAHAAQWAGIATSLDIYGLGAILLAHVFFNLPLAVRLLLAALGATPANHYRLASQFGMNERALLRFVEWPALAAALPGVSMLVGTLCLTSFTIVLLLGGGPAATTLEVEIYQSLRYDFDPARAAMLVGVQLSLVVFAGMLAGNSETAGDPSMVVRRPARRLPAWLRVADFMLVGGAALFVAMPLLAILISGLRADFVRLLGESTTQRAFATSLFVGSCSAVLAVSLALLLAASRKSAVRARNPLAFLLDKAAYWVLAFPVSALGAGWFLLVYRHVDVAWFAIPLVITLNAAMALPFAYRIIRPAHDIARDRSDRLCASLGIAGLSRWRLVDWPLQRVAILSALAFAGALSLGDLGVIVFFGSEHLQTLPWLLFSRMGSYRTADAEGIALLLALLCLGLMLLADRLAAVRPN